MQQFVSIETNLVQIITKYEILIQIEWNQNLKFELQMTSNQMVQIEHWSKININKN